MHGVRDAPTILRAPSTGLFPAGRLRRRRRRRRSSSRRGKEYSAQGDFVGAGLEFKNAIQIDPKFAEAYHQLGLSQLSRTDIRGAYGSLSKATELDPKLLPAQTQLGRLFLMVGEHAEGVGKSRARPQERPGRRGRPAPQGAALVSGKETAVARAYMEGLL